MYKLILEFAGTISAAPGAKELEELIINGLPTLLSADCFLGLFDQQSHQHLRPILPTLAADRPVPLDVDAGFLSVLGDPTHPRALLVMGLAYPTGLLGIVGFELGTHPIDYPAISSQIAGAIHVAELREEIADQRMLAERSLQERHAAAERSKATTVLASGVAHDLNNALGPLIALTECVRREIAEHHATGKQLDSDIIEDIQSIQSSALRATETIKDLMTLGRIGRLRHS